MRVTDVVDSPSERAVAQQRAARTGTILVLISAASFGVMAILIKLAYAAGLNLGTLLVLRFTIAAAGMWLIWLGRRRQGPRSTPSFAVLVPLILMGSIGYVGQSFAYFTAVSMIPASTTGLLLYTYPTVVTLLAWLVLREKMTPRKIIALVIATLGTLLVLGIGSNLLGALNPAGVAWALAASLIYSVYIVAGTRFTVGLDPTFASAVIITSAAGVYWAWGAISGDLYFQVAPEGYLWAFMIAVVSTITAIATFFAGLRLIGPSKASIISTVEPAVTVSLAALVLGEQINPEQILGGVLIVTAVVILQARARRPQSADIPEPA